MSARLRAYGPAAFWTCVVLLIGSRPNVTLPQFAIPLDKVGHFAMYGVLGAFLGMGWGRRRRHHWAWFVTAMLLVGAIDELHQRTVPGRSAEIADWIVDAIGSGICFWLAARRSQPVRLEREA